MTAHRRHYRRICTSSIPILAILAAPVLPITYRLQCVIEVPFTLVPSPLCTLPSCQNWSPPRYYLRLPGLTVPQAVKPCSMGKQVRDKDIHIFLVEEVTAVSSGLDKPGGWCWIDNNTLNAITTLLAGQLSCRPQAVQCLF